MTNAYQQAYEASLKDPQAFWAEAAKDISWYKTWDKVLDDSRKPFYRWFSGAEVNTCYNAVDRHVEGGRGAQAAIIYDSPVTNTKRTITYAELQDEVSKFAGALRGLGVDKGDRVIVYMPMVPEAVVAMLACARLGAVHSVVFGGFASNELATRINDAQPKVIVSASCGIETTKVIPYKPLLDHAIELADHKPLGTIILKRAQADAELKPGYDHDWAEITAKATPAECVKVAATDPKGRSVDELLRDLKIAAGMATPVVKVHTHPRTGAPIVDPDTGAPKVTTYLVLESLAFQSMDQARFREVFDRFVGLLCTDVLPGTGRDRLLAEVLETLK